VILDVSCGPGDYSVAWTSQIAQFLPEGMAFYCTDCPDGISRETGETYAMTTAKKIQAAAAENGNLRLAQPPVATDADLFSGHDALMPPGKTADILHWSHSGYHVRDALGAARNDPRAIEAGLHAAGGTRQYGFDGLGPRNARQLRRHSAANRPCLSDIVEGWMMCLSRSLNASGNWAGMSPS
jgi:hypothetical protein